jgi:predicted GH43/DUF377 family glycosyl hydrolase
MAKLHNLPVRLQADPARVVIRPFHIAVEPRGLNPTQVSRARRIVNAVLAMDSRTCQSELALVNKDFETRHRQTRQVFEHRYEQMAAELELADDLRPQQRELIGAYFCHEYSYAAAALMNPSIVPHPDQAGLPEGALRFVMSLRAVGEGHISSVEFREGVLSGDGRLTLTPLPDVAIAADGEIDGSVVEIHRLRDTALSGTVLFPMTPAQRNGLEDLRLVRFEDEEGPIYYGTYTAYSGSAIASELLTTRDFRAFRLSPMSGEAAHNKGMALFPRKINGRYAVIGRQDNENIFYLESDSLTHWEKGDLIAGPMYPWDLVQMGNCGSPMEIDEGWLMLTHGVGAMRKYSIGAMLLDKDDPRKVIGRTAHPILSPADEDREGYVPNVVYTCGGLALGRRLFLPYGVADSSVGFCWIDLDELVAEMR